MHNEYSQQIPDVFYLNCPKSVFAALTIELANLHVFPDGVPPGLSSAQYYQAVADHLLQVWYGLHLKGVIFSPPPKHLWPQHTKPPDNVHDDRHY